MYEIYERNFLHPFAGAGKEQLIVKDDTILAHVLTWDDPGAAAGVAEEDVQPATSLVGQEPPESGDWQKVRQFDLENAQPWARELVEARGYR